MKIATLILLLTTTCAAQSFPHWPANTHVKVYLFHGAFKPKEQKRIQAAIDSWGFPSGITMEIIGETESTMTCDGCLTVNREDCRKGEWGDIQATHFNGLISFAVVSLDRHGGSGKALQRLMAHEIGHSQGLNDTNAKDSVMSNQWHSGSDPRPTGKDVEWVRLVYAGDKNADNSRTEGSNQTVETNRDSLQQDGIPKTAQESAAKNWPLPQTGLQTKGLVYAGGQENGLATRNIDISRRTLVGDSTPSLILRSESRNTLWRSEQATREAFKQHSCRRTVLIQTLDANGNATGEYRRVSLVVLGDDGRRLEKVLSNPKSTLKTLKITKADIEDFSNGQMFGPDVAHADLYRFYGEGSEVSVRADQTKGVRVFQGSLMLDDKGRITKVSGRTYPEGKERFPLFTATRIQVGEYLFPSKVEANDTLYFEKSTVRVRWTITFTNYKQFKSSVSITEATQF